ncbi:MAG: carbon storage regulator [Planctomycetaceae bacterium]
MQTMTRRVNEGLVIGDDIEVTVLEIHEDHVRLGILAPHEEPSYWEQILYVERSESERQLEWSELQAL